VVGGVLRSKEVHVLVLIGQGIGQAAVVGHKRRGADWWLWQKRLPYQLEDVFHADA